ncbi:MAG: heme ABC exporter ATP-binding protein CcmA [Hyphomicrobiaceae bacterium]
MQLRVENLSLSRGERTLVRGMTFAVEASEAVILRGPNGAGKTTLLRAIAGFIKPSSGSIRFEGGNPELSVAEQSHAIGHQNAVKAALTVRENADFWRRFQASGDANEPGPAEQRTSEALQRLGLGAIADVPAGYLSAGQKRRLALTRLLLAPRPLWLLDEPTVSLDADATLVLSHLIAEHRATGGLILAATHIDLGLATARELRLEAPALTREAAWDHS